VGQLVAGEDGNGGGDIAYVCTYDAVLSAFRLDDGQTLWTSPVVQGLSPGAGCSLQALDGMLLSQVPLPDARGNPVPTIVARRAGDGRVLWQEPLGLGINRGGVEYYLDRQNLQVVAYRAVDGAVLWRIPGGSDYLAGDGDVIAFAQNQRGQGESLEAVAAADGAVLWRYPYPADRDLSLLAVGGGLVLARSSGTWSIHRPAPPGTDTHNYLLALGTRDGRLYWQMPLDLFSLAVGESA
jgi:outer membrane protein assembly factor BamB